MPHVHNGSDDASGLRFAVIVSRFNDFITSRLLDGCLSQLKEQGADDDHIDVYWVPGAFEIPLQAQACGRSSRFDAVICLGAVIRGETDHYQLVAEETARGIARVSLDTGVPCIFEVLATPTLQLAMARAGGEAGNKGEEAAAAAVEAARVLRTVTDEV